MRRTLRPPRPLRHRRRWLSSFSAGYRRRETAALRVSVGVLYLWFGVLKLIPGLSPAQDIATHAMSVMTFHMVPPSVSQPLLAAMEVLIGVGLITGRLLPLTLAVFFVHMAGVFATLAILPGEVWQHPFVPSMEGQYIIKNLVLVAACLSVATAAVRGGAERPTVHERAEEQREKAGAGVR
ncbi:DoxX family protein [Streptomyces sp. NPDC000410]|uniref:DoxX family membrane protein n=1 Tax=Streptomyces sp. NPDC000410 TaxID=3154254 RepID=UPI0033218AD7